MLEPTGPLPPSVYWRRRVFAVGGAVLALGLIVWLLSSWSDESVAPTSADDKGEDGVRVAVSSPASSSRGPASSSTSASPTSGAPTSSGQPSPSPGAASSVRLTGPPPPPPKPPKPPPRCSDAMLKLVVGVGKPAYRVGERPQLTMVLTNAGPEPCVKDVSRQFRELVVTGRGRTEHRVWSSIDCYPPPSREKPVLRPGQQLRFDLNWAGRTSAPGCPLDRSQVPAGEYQLIGKIGKLTSAPAPFRLI